MNTVFSYAPLSKAEPKTTAGLMSSCCMRKHSLGQEGVGNHSKDALQSLLLLSTTDCSILQDHFKKLYVSGTSAGREQERRIFHSLPFSIDQSFASLAINSQALLGCAQWVLSRVLSICLSKEKPGALRQGGPGHLRRAVAKMSIFTCMQSVRILRAGSC